MDDSRHCHSRFKRARYLALHDDLTGLPNRQYFLRRLRIALRRGVVSPPGVAIIYLYLEGLEAITHAHGGAAGDRLLALATSRLVQCARAEDFVSRIVDSEFACLVTRSLSRQQLQLLGCSIHDCMCMPFHIGTAAVHLHASIGISSYPADGMTVESLMGAATEELARARERVGEKRFPEAALHGQGPTEIGRPAAPD